MLTKNVDAIHGGTSEQYAADLVAQIKVNMSARLLLYPVY